MIFNYQSIDYQTEMKKWEDTIIVPPLDIQNVALMINMTDFNISVATTSDPYSLTSEPLGSSNVYFDASSNDYYFVTVDKDQRGMLYSGSDNFSNIYNFTDNTLLGYFFGKRSVSSLDIFDVQGQQYIGLTWQPDSSSNYQYDLIRQGNDSKFENYSSMVVLNDAKTARFIDYDSILIYGSYCQIVEINPLNPRSLNEGVLGI